jgi:hypothetical protein
MGVSPAAAIAVLLIGAWIVGALAQPDMPSD